MVQDNQNAIDFYLDKFIIFYSDCLKQAFSYFHRTKKEDDED